MDADVSVRAEFILNCTLNFFCDIVRLFQGHCAVHPNVNLNCNVVAYAACAQVVGLVNLGEGCYY